MDFASILFPTFAMVIFFCLASSKPTDFQPSIASLHLRQVSLQALGEALPGVYSNVQQYHRHAQKGLPPNKRHFLLKSEFYKVQPPLFNASLTIFYQEFTKSSSKPFDSGFYSFTVDEEMNTLRMRILKLKKGALQLRLSAPNFTISPSRLDNGLGLHQLQAQQLRSYSACDMFWKRIGQHAFVGITGPQCLASLGDHQVRIGVSMTLTQDKLLLTEGWYKVKDGTSISEVKVPYILKKLNTKAKASKPTVSMFKSNEIMNDIDDDDKHNHHKNDVDLYQQMSSKRLSRRRGNFRNNFLGFRNPQRFHRVRNLRIEQRVLRNFRQVAAAVTSGHDVYFRVELSACAVPEQAKVERFSFGGKITDFVFVRNEGTHRKDYLFFSIKKTVMGVQGAEYITRELTLLRGGRVEVKVIKIFADPYNVASQYVFQCKLFNDRKGLGAVKVSLDPSSHINSIRTFRAVKSSLGQGRDLRLVADLARCQGKQKSPAVVMGSKITEYDVVNNGKTLEIFVPINKALSSPRMDVQGEGFIGQFFKNGDVIFTKINENKSRLLRHVTTSSAYTCQLSNRKAVVTNEESEENSVKVFYGT